MTSDQSESEAEEWSPHLVFLVPGMNGCSEHFDFVSEKLLSVWGEEVIVHACSANNDSLLDVLTLDKSYRTCDGIEAGGRRIAEEVIKCVNAWDGDPPLSISFWGHSMGGLYARYAIAELLDEDGSGTICGLPPRLFITTACPHIGVAGTFTSHVVDAVSALGVLGESGWLAKSGQQLFWEDDELFLWHLACEDRYIEALEKFQFRALVANISNDFVVDFCVSALQPRCPSWLSDNAACPALSQLYPHVVYDSQSFNYVLESLDLEAPDFKVPSLPRERSKFQRGASCTTRESLGDSALSSLSSWLWGSNHATANDELTPDPSPKIYCSGHPHELSMEAARLRLAALPWRLICMRFDDYPGQNAHDAVICKVPWMNANDGVDYIAQVVLRPIFGNLPLAKKSLDFSDDDDSNDDDARDALESSSESGQDPRSNCHRSSSGNSLCEQAAPESTLAENETDDDEKIWL